MPNSNNIELDSNNNQLNQNESNNVVTLSVDDIPPSRHSYFSNSHVTISNSSRFTEIYDHNLENCIKEIKDQFIKMQDKIDEYYKPKIYKSQNNKKYNLNKNKIIIFFNLLSKTEENKLDNVLNSCNNNELILLNKQLHNLLNKIQKKIYDQI